MMLSRQGKKNHPRASRIPDVIFEEVYQSYLSDFNDTLMQLERSQLSDYLNENQKEAIEEPLLTFYSIAIAHTSLNADSLIDIAKWLYLTDQDVFFVAIEIGHLDLINQILVEQSSEEQQKMIEVDQYRAFRLAAKRGYLPILMRLFELAGSRQDEIIQQFEYMIFEYAAENEHRHILQYLYDLAGPKQQAMLGASFNHAFYKVAEKGDLETLIFLFERDTEFHLRWVIQRSLTEAAKNGHLHVLHYVFDFILSHFAIDDEYLVARVVSVLKAAAENGHLHVLNYTFHVIYERSLNITDEVFVDAFCMAAAAGHADVISCLLTLFPEKKQELVEARQYCAINASARKGHLEVLKLLLDLTPNIIQINQKTITLDLVIFDISVENGYIHMIDHFLSDPRIFEYVEKNPRRYDEQLLRLFIYRTLQNLYERNAMGKEEHHKTVDLDSKEAEICLCCLRYLSEQNDETDREHILFLRDILAVKTGSELRVM